jgi:hypothetical protein
MSESSGSLYRMGTALAPPDSTNLTYDAAIQERLEEEEEEEEEEEGAESQFLSDSLVFSPHVGCDRIPIKGLLFVPPGGSSSDSSSPPPSALTCDSWFAKEFLPPNGYSVLSLILGSSRILLVPLAASAWSIQTNGNASSSSSTSTTTLWSMKDCILLANQLFTFNDEQQNFFFL